MQAKNENLTFRQLDKNIFLPEPASALEEWYASIRDTKLGDLGIESLARACRQNLYPENIVPLCLQRLEREPLAGEMYDGEVINALKNISNSYWLSHPIERSKLLAIAAAAYEITADIDIYITESDLSK